MRIIHRETEKKTIKLICQGTLYSSWLLGSINESYFGNKYLQEAYRRIASIARTKQEILSWDELLSDSSLSQSAKIILEDYTKKVNATSEECKKTFGSLNKYRKLRVAYDTGKYISDELQKESVDAEQLIQQITSKIASASSKAEQFKISIVGKGNNSVNIVKDILKGKSDNIIPTGIKEFDNVNHGIIRNSLFLIGSPTGVGKTLTAAQLKSNFASYGCKVGHVSLEMDREEVLIRDLARWSGVSMNKLISPISMTDNDKKKVLRSYTRRVRELKKKGASEHIIVPEEDISMAELLLSTKPYEYDVLIIDYIGLLSDADADDQWKKLGQITRLAKLHATRNNMIVICLVQVTPEGIIRYSRAMAENANLVWIMTRDEKAKATNLINVDVVKARNQKLMKFMLETDYEHMTFKSIDEEEVKKRFEAYAKNNKVVKEPHEYKGRPKNTKKVNNRKDNNDYFESRKKVT
jgi:replicative DNA helicase